MSYYEFADHALTQSRGTGPCLSLKGSVWMTVIFIDDAESSWTDADLQKAMNVQERAAKSLTEQAAQYGQRVTLRFERRRVKMNQSCTSDNARAWAPLAMSKAGLPTSDPNNTLEREHGYSEAPVCFCFNREQRAFAYPSMNECGFEFFLQYTNGGAGTFLHELCHIFGAEDYYYPDLVAETAKDLFPNSLMRSSRNCEIDSLTAYLIGWTEVLSPQAITFLKRTASLTTEGLIAATREQSLTGHGTRTYSGGSSYTGELQRGIRHGYGKMVYTDGSFYEGYWINGSKSGKGTYRWANGDVYTGQWADGDMNGNGTLVYRGGNRYEGEWKNDKRHGRGTFYWTDGDAYVGSWRDGFREGHGVMIYSNGNRYEGEWLHGDRHGHGVMTYSSGRYDGEWTEGKRHGKGRMRWNGGNEYNGDWQNDSRTGYGVLRYACGDRYEGQWKNDKFDGEGSYYWASGNKHVGKFRNGMFHGQGVRYRADGSSYAGSWQDDEYKG